MRHFAIATCFLLILFSPPAWANFAEGQARFQGGDYKGALETWLPLAEEGDARAQFSVGILYEQGLGVEANMEEAHAWYTRASAQGYAPATAALRALQPRMVKPATPAAAPQAPAPKVEAPKLTEKQQIEQVVHALLQQLNLQLRTGQLQHGAVEVEEAPDGFDVAVRDLMLLGDPGERLEIGDVTAHIARDGKRYYRIEFLLPPTLNAYESEQGPPVRIDIPKQSNMLVWDRDLELMVDIDLKWADVTLTSPEGMEAARIDSLTVVSDLVDKQGLWSGPVSFKMQGVTVTEPHQGSFRVGEVGFRTLIENLDMVRYAELSRAVQTGAQAPDQTIGQLRDLFSGAAVEIAMSDLGIEFAGGPQVALKSANYRFGIGGFNQSLATVDMGYSHTGLAGPPPQVPELAPRDGRIHFILEHLPMQTLLETGIAAVMEYIFFGEVGQQGDVLNQLRIALSNAGTRFIVHDGNFDGPKLALTVAGVLSADAQALWGVSGVINLSVVGLDNLIGLLQAGAPPPQPNQPSPGDMLRSFGKLDADGKTYIYEFQLNQQGQFLVNGQDATPLMMVMFGG